MRKSEILAPAGNLKTAIAAYESGADAVYLGLHKFSARKSADNFDFIRLRRLKQFAQDHGKKIYVTINTLLTDPEFPELIETLETLSQIDIDAIIIQDYGVLKYIRDHFPSIEVHASTQMAIHNVAGARAARDLGFSRVVLSRELGAQEISDIAKAVPDLELEVFIHGALCYSFSGLCLASGMMLERSGNRGECAQICRTYFEDGDNREKSYPFSCNDLGLKERVLDLVDAGVASLKIEGRMKSPEYVSSVVTMYRHLLDKRTLFAQHEFNSTLTFSRSNGEGFFRSSFGSNLINRSHSGHKGVEIGKVVKASGNRAFVKTNIQFRPFDSVSVFSESGVLKGGAQLKRFNRDRNDSSVMWLEIPVEGISVGDSLFLAGRSEKKRADIDEKGYPLYKKDIRVSITLEKDQILVSCDQRELVNAFSIEEGRNAIDLVELFNSQLSKTGESLYRFSVENIDNKTGLVNPFIPQSKAKAIRRELSALIDAESAEERMVSSEKITFQNSDNSFVKLRRNLFVESSPFVIKEQLDVALLPHHNDVFYIPLMPLLFDEKEYFEAVQNLIDANSDKHFSIGINNIAHLELVRSLENRANVSFFIDFYLYLANSHSISFVSETLSKIDFAYGWVEGTALPSLVDIEDKDQLPLFIARGCYQKHNLMKSCDGCSKRLSTTLSNKNRNFRVEVIDCITYLFSDT